MTKDFLVEALHETGNDAHDTLRPKSWWGAFSSIQDTFMLNILNLNWKYSVNLTDMK